MFNSDLEDSRSEYDEDDAHGRGSSTAEKREAMSQQGATGPELKGPELRLNGSPLNGYENGAVSTGVPSQSEAVSSRHRAG